MKLISFVAISFLAITVSAQAPQKYSYQNIRSSQSPRQFDQAEVEAEIERLTVEYEKEEEIFSSIKIDVKIKRQNAWTLKNQADLIAAELKEAGLNSHARLELEGKHRAYKAEWTDLNVEYEDQQFPRYAKAKERRDNAKAVLDLLMENKERIKKHNTENVVQIGLSPKSLYNIGFLKDQKNEILKELAMLLAEWEKVQGLLTEWTRIKADKNGLNVDGIPPKDNLVTQRIELRNNILLCETQRDIAMKILQDYKQCQSIGARTRKFFYSYMPNGPIE
ncbi:hypothetical protein BASA61_001615 [Batrachochytrium salamandrivorans]|nr:hypothetical protein BASA62_002912 [Batrachochytrium salamandrivorans]KAH6581752.1 hypothetical protein BASA60_002245 [Batrachochytrium salamandrivorans]KAH6601912.1 hypothetical protein BASA61_001615 [Batrachochytrium salamandrivorans]KAH9248225.1 hypothetical protein BASA81_014146 [Batrachochytrium salamandrivorans]